jgi:hypothetical protein
MPGNRRLESKLRVMMEAIMPARLIILLLFIFFAQFACAGRASDSAPPNTSNGSSPVEGNSAAPESDAAPSKAGAKSDQPRTVRDFFMLLPEKYFLLEGCDRARDKDCRKAKVDYLKTFAEVEDTANGYLKGGCDGAQSCMEMALFKRPDGTYLVGLTTSNEMMNDYYFLDYTDGKWTDISSKVVPEFSKKNMYELPRYGTTMQVFSTKLVEKGGDYEIRDKAAKLYDLEWKDGRFNKKK